MTDVNVCKIGLHIFKSEVKAGDKCHCGFHTWNVYDISVIFNLAARDELAKKLRKGFVLIKGGKQ